MKARVWSAALVAALFTAGCGVMPALTGATAPERAATNAPVLLPSAEVKQQRLRHLQSIRLCPGDGLPDGLPDGLADGQPI